VQHFISKYYQNGTAHFKNGSNYLNTNIYPYLKTSGDQSSSLYLSIVCFSTPGLIRPLWQLKTAVFLHWCLIYALLLGNVPRYYLHVEDRPLS
jgi:hypothetical protein